MDQARGWTVHLKLKQTNLCEITLAKEWYERTLVVVDLDTEQNIQ